MNNNKICVQRFLPLILLGILMCTAAWGSTAGPDAYGYKATDDTTYSFVDISTKGAAVLGGADDDRISINIGFPFAFYGKVYSEVCASSNGILSFGGCNPMDFANQDITGTATDGDLPTIAPLWLDLTFAVNGAGSVRYQTLGAPGSRRFVVQWQKAFVLNGSKGLTFQAILQEADSGIQFQYLDIYAGAGSKASLGGIAAVGLRDTGGQASGRVLQWSFKSPVLKNGQAILFSVVAVQTITNLTARAKPGKIDLVWAPVPGAVTYNIYRSTNKGGPYTKIKAGHVTTYCTYADSRLTNGTTYYYRVTSVDATGVESLQSNEASATPRAR